MEDGDFCICLQGVNRVKLNDKHILVTGAARGLGKAIALYLADKKANLTLVDLTVDSLEATKRDCEYKGVQVSALAANVCNEDQVVNVVEQSVNTLGPLQGLINNAGILRDGLLIKTSEGKVTSKLALEQWQAVIDTNLTGVFLFGREVASSMVETQSEGVIINISSVSKAGNFGQSNYAAAKAGVVALTSTWSKELARYGIRCAAIAPGVIETEMTATMPTKAKEKINRGIALGHMGKPEDIAKTVSFIFENDYITGRTLEVDGGLKL